VAWQRTTANLYGHTQTVYYKTMVAQWYRACGVGLLRVRGRARRREQGRDRTGCVMGPRLDAIA
jgi:hypothetical protein